MDTWQKAELEEIERNNDIQKATKAALFWHDFICWVREEKEVPVDEYLEEYKEEN